MFFLNSKQKRLSKFIWQGCFLIPISNFLKRFLPTKRQGFAKYAIISAVYNTQDYLKDFLNSIINQRLKFENNIFLILIDDASTDESAQIIEKYRSKYPKNIFYLYKENGGQASARNLGLEFLKQSAHYKNIKKQLNQTNLTLNAEICKALKEVSWVSFADSDDMLDRNYFFAVDKFLKNHQNDNLCMLSSSLIFYREKMKIRYKDTHPLSFKFKDKEKILKNENLNEYLQLHMNIFLKLDKLFQSDLKFDENLKPSFEDAKFINEFLLSDLSAQSAFLPQTKYYYRKRFNKSSSLDKIWQDKNYFLNTPKNGTLSLLEYAQKKCAKIPLFIQNLVLYHLFWQIQELIDKPEKLSFLSQSEQEEYLKLLERNFTFIDTQTIINFNLCGIEFWQKVGIMACFKNEKLLPQKAFITKLQGKNEEVKIIFFTKDKNALLNLKINDQEVLPKNEKIISHSFLNRVFVYEKSFWISLTQNALNLELFIDKKPAKISFQNKDLNLNTLKKKLAKLKQKYQKNANLWLLADMPLKADDNAEHLYRYISLNHTKQKIAFVLSKKSSDYQRLKNEGFKLVDPKSLKFKLLLFKAQKIISSHIDRYLFEGVGKKTLEAKDFIFLQHGVTKDDISKWLNQRKIDLFITATKDEFHSIADDFNAYKFGIKEVKLTGLARHDALLLKDVPTLKQVLVMPTWRQYLSGTYSKKMMKRRLNEKFFESEYFRAWSAFLASSELEVLCKKYEYSVVFAPHPQVRGYLKGFKLPPFIQIADENTSLQKLFKQSALMITDYSSVAFEMAYLQKPVLYYQFDETQFFGGAHWKRGYFDYRKNGFGAVCVDEKNLLNELEKCLKNGCTLEKVYQKNMQIFEYKDSKNCERIFNAINNL